MILVVGLSSVWQRTLFFDRFHPGEVNRATRVLETASGKGVNVARVAGLLGMPACVLTTAGGSRGTLFTNALKADRVPALIVPISGETRLCQTLIGKPVVTELVEEAPPLSPQEVQAVQSAFIKALGKATLVVLSGTVPKGCGDAFFASLARLARQHNIPVLADTQKAQLQQVAREQPALIKVNAAELRDSTGKRTLSGGIRELARLGTRQVVVSRGARPVMAFDGKSSWMVSPPAIEAVNPIGSGDAMMAGLATGLARGQSLQAALRLGIACGAANALTETSGVIRPADVKRLLRR